MQFVAMLRIVDMTAFAISICNLSILNGACGVNGDRKINSGLDICFAELINKICRIILYISENVRERIGR